MNSCENWCCSTGRPPAYLKCGRPNRGRPGIRSMWPLPSATRSGAFVDVAVLERQALGMVLTLNAYAMLSIQDATVKWLVDAVPVWQVLFVRSAVLVIGCLVLGG